MKKSDMGQAVGILANVGVLLGILLLVYELSQNRTMMDAQTRTAATEGFTNHIYHVTSDPDLADIMARGNRGEELSDVERSRYFLTTAALLRYYENVHYQYRLGLYSEDEFRGQREAWKVASFSSDGIRAQFCDGLAFWSPEFAADVEGLLSEPCD